MRSTHLLTILSQAALSEADFTASRSDRLMHCKSFLTTTEETTYHHWYHVPTTNLAVCQNRADPTIPSLQATETAVVWPCSEGRRRIVLFPSPPNVNQLGVKQLYRILEYSLGFFIIVLGINQSTCSYMVHAFTTEICSFRAAVGRY